MAAGDLDYNENWFEALSGGSQSRADLSMLAAPVQPGKFRTLALASHDVRGAMKPPSLGAHVSGVATSVTVPRAKIASVWNRT